MRITASVSVSWLAGSVMIPTVSLCPGVPRENDDQPRTERGLRPFPHRVPTQKGSIDPNEPGLRPSPVLCPKGKFAGGTTGAHKMQCGPGRPTVAAYGHKPLRCSDFYNFTVAGLGRLRSMDCDSHGRGPRFDPLCAHHKSPLLLGFYHCLKSPTRQDRPERCANTPVQSVENPWTSFTPRSRGLGVRHASA